MALERVDGDGSGFARPKLGLAFAARHAETLLVLLVLGVALVIGLATAADYELASDPCDGPCHWPCHRDAQRRGDHARLPRWRHEPVRARGAAAPWPRGLWQVAPDRLAYTARHTRRLANGDCALAVVADRTSAHTIPRGLSALCYARHLVRIPELGPAHVHR